MGQGADRFWREFPRGKRQGHKEDQQGEKVPHDADLAVREDLGRVGATHRRIPMTQTPKDLVDAANQGVPQISAEDAKALHGAQGVVFLDVREPGEVAGGKVVGAVAIPRGVLEWQTDQLADAKTVVVYCAAGGRASLAGETLRKLGFEDVRNAGGFEDWVEAGGAVE